VPHLPPARRAGPPAAPPVVCKSLRYMPLKRS
jgi:hypothetical protein